MNHQERQPIVTVTLNPALDQTVHVSQFQTGQVNRVFDQRVDPGGKGINVAKVVRALGHSVCVTGFLGQDNCHGFYEYFRKQGISNHFVELSGAARVNIKIVDEPSNQVTEINFPGLTCTPPDLDKLQQVIKGLAHEGQWFVLSGSLPQGVSEDIYQQMIVLLKKQGAKVFLDSSGSALREGIKAIPHAMKPNLDELSQLVGRPLEQETEIRAAVEELLASGIQQVIVSLGARGAIVAQNQEFFIARPPAVVAKSTVGAGDAMVAGFVAGQTERFSLKDCIRLGTAAATASVIQPGTQAGSLQQVAEILPMVQINPW